MPQRPRPLKSSQRPRPLTHNHTSDTLEEGGSSTETVGGAFFDVSNRVISVSSPCGCCFVSRVSMGVDFQEELSDMLLLKMLQAATRASADKDRVRVDSSSGFIVLSYQHVCQPSYSAAGQVECGAGAWEPASLPAAEPSEPLCLPAAPGSSRPRTHPNR